MFLCCSVQTWSPSASQILCIREGLSPVYLCRLTLFLAGGSVLSAGSPVSWVPLQCHEAMGDSKLEIQWR